MLPLLRRVFWSLLLLGSLAACSSLTLGYGQLPRLASFWVNRFVDLDRPQQAQFDRAFAELHAWHRREELPRLQTLLGHADRAVDDGQLTRAELDALEAELAQSLDRTLIRTAPLVAPLLASFSPAQWQELQAAMDKRLAKWWKEQSAGPSTLQAERSKLFARSMARWLGDLDTHQLSLARQRASQWPTNTADAEILRQERARRQQQIVAGLQQWARGADDPTALQAGTQMLLAAANRDGSPRGPAEARLREQVLADALAVVNAASATHWPKVRAHWAGWRADLARLQARG